MAVALRASISASSVANLPGSGLIERALPRLTDGIVRTDCLLEVEREFVESHHPCEATGMGAGETTLEQVCVLSLDLLKTDWSSQ